MGHAIAVYAFFQFNRLTQENLGRGVDLVIAGKQLIHLFLGVNQRAAVCKPAGGMGLQDSVQIIDKQRQCRLAAAPRLFPAPAFNGGASVL
ncbi:hypothetical protein D3C87_1485910 [compost metagenome]